MGYEKMHGSHGNPLYDYRERVLAYELNYVYGSYVWFYLS